MAIASKSSNSRVQRSLALFAGGISLAICDHAHADPYNLLYSFGATDTDAASPFGSLIVSGNTLYGTTSGGGDSQDGTIFQYEIGGSESVLYSFAGGISDGSSPMGTLAMAGDTLYGMTSSGGAGSDGTIFQFNTNTSTENVLYSFTGESDGGSPQMGALTIIGSKLYGMTNGGGNSNAGTIFQYDTSLALNAYKVLHTFAASTDGASPQGSLTLSGATTFYGMANLQGGGGHGTLFEFNNLATPTYTVLHPFAGGTSDGGTPFGSVIQDGTLLLGLTASGGASAVGSNAGSGTLFEYNTVSNTFSILHSFGVAANDGEIPEGSLLQEGSMLYGTTLFGGDKGEGTLFQYNLTTDAYSVLYSFGDDVLNDGQNPYGSLIAVGSTLYGMTEAGGANGAGTLFSISVPEPSSVSLLVIGGILCLRRRRASRG